MKDQVVLITGASGGIGSAIAAALAGGRCPPLPGGQESGKAERGPGRTAIPMQEEVHRFEGKPYDPARFLQPEDVAAAIVQALACRAPRS